MNSTSRSRPQTIPRTTQLKIATGAVSRKLPVAPPVYRPQPVPKVLQTKSSSARTPPAVHARRQPVAPPVFRPQSQPIVTQVRKPVHLKPHGVTTPLRGNAAQVKPAALVQRQKTAAAPSHTPYRSIASQTIQRTIWRYRDGAWATESTGSSDKDTHPPPQDYCKTNKIKPKQFDKYDQETGDYIKWKEARSYTAGRAQKRKRPNNFGDFFNADRVKTPYGFFKPEGVGKGSQGPHLVAFTMKRTIFDMANQMGLSPEAILNSKLMPHPRQALNLMKTMLRARSIEPRSQVLYDWYEAYKKAYNQVVRQNRGYKKSVKQALELHPLTVYRVGEVASEDETKGKSEKANKAMDDIDKILAQVRSKGLPTDLVTIDSGYKNEGWLEGDKFREDFIFNYAYLAMGRPPSPSPYPDEPNSPTPDDTW